MSSRRLLRIVLSLVLLGLFWTRALRSWQEWSTSRLIAGVSISFILLFVVAFEMASARHLKTRARDEVPKRPLGLD